MKQTDNKPRNLSRHQYGTLKFIADNKVTLGYLRHAHGTTLGSIAYHRWIEVRGTGDDALVYLTKAGEEELKSYNHATLNERSHEADITERCMRLLKHARSRVVPIQKTA
jgi:hypothetical protein